MPRWIYVLFYLNLWFGSLWVGMTLQFLYEQSQLNERPSLWMLYTIYGGGLTLLEQALLGYWLVIRRHRPPAGWKMREALLALSKPPAHARRYTWGMISVLLLNPLVVAAGWWAFS